MAQTTLNDAIVGALSSYTGSVNDRLLTYYLANGATLKSIADAEKQFLKASGGTLEQLEDLWNQVLTTNGYTTGSVTEKKLAFWTAGGTLWSPAKLFAASEQGVWFDPSDITTLFQDSTGTTPVTAVEQPVGKILDKSGRGNHATQATAGSRPTYRARYNLLTFSEQFDNVAWAAVGMAARVVNDIVAPDGTTTADRIPGDGVASSCRIFQSSVAQLAGRTVSVYAKAGTNNFIQIYLDTDVNPWANYDLSNGTVGSVGTTCTASMVNVGNGWYRCILSTTSTTATNFTILLVSSAAAARFASFTTSTYVYLWGADCRAGASVGTYQRIAAATSYDTVGFKPYLDFDGVDDSLATPAIDLSTTDKISIFWGLLKNTDAARRGAFNFGDSSVTNGTFGFLAPQSAGGNGNLQFQMRGTVTNNTDGFTGATDTYPAGKNYVLTCLGAIGTPSMSLSVNQVVAISGATTNGTGNFTSQALTLGAFPALSNLSGRIYSFIMRAATTDAPTIAKTEAYVNSKTGAY
jgi:hypothetical protein